MIKQSKDGALTFFGKEWTYSHSQKPSIGNILRKDVVVRCDLLYFVLRNAVFDICVRIEKQEGVNVATFPLF